VARELFASRLGFLFATIGSAVGVGNIWRFPSLVGQNGGGAFLLAYLIIVLGSAIPLLILELAVGRKFGTSAIGAFVNAGKRYRWLGILIVLMVGGVLSYYLVIIAWGLGFLARSAAGQALDFAQFSKGWDVLIFFIVSLLLVVTIVAVGVKAGTERASVFLMPLLFLLIIAMAAYTMTLAGRNDGLSFYLKPNLELLAHGPAWSRALGQAFFSVGVGMGVMITYGSYVARTTDLHTSALIVVFADTACAVLVGLMIFPMVFTFGLQPQAGATLAFQTLPVAFDMLPASRLLAAVFFLLFSIAGLTSAVSMLEAVSAPLIDGWKWPRWRAVATAGMLVLLAGLPSALSYTQVDLRLGAGKFLDVIDDNLGTLGVPIGALVTSLVMSWAIDRSGLIAEINQSSRIPVGKLVVLLNRYIVPAVLVATIVFMLLRRFVWT